LIIYLLTINQCSKCGKLILFRQKICPRCRIKFVNSKRYTCLNCNNQNIKKYQSLIKHKQ
jgi:predicted amidophosphoribosyltransferase